MDEVKSYEESTSQIKYTGNWESATNSESSGGKFKYTEKEGDKAVLEFEGTGIKLYGVNRPDRGKAKITVDGVEKIVDQYSSTAKYQAKTFELTNLSKGKHRVEIEVLGQKSTGSTGTKFTIDKIEIVNGNLTY